MNSYTKLASANFKHFSNCLSVAFGLTKSKLFLIVSLNKLTS
ncbi:MAG: hypothetical protein Q8S84_08655 [bacterium]|nr:hypothetical protein [bacterium]